jgi:hypothetical protein
MDVQIRVTASKVGLMPVVFILCMKKVLEAYLNKLEITDSIFIYLAESNCCKRPQKLLQTF